MTAKISNMFGNLGPIEISDSVARLYLEWFQPGIGFGQLQIEKLNGKYVIDNEYMSKEWVRIALYNWVDNVVDTATLEDMPPSKATPKQIEDQHKTLVAARDQRGHLPENWYAGFPPFIGWWATTWDYESERKRSVKNYLWRWFDGTTFSEFSLSYYEPSRASKIAERKSQTRQKIIWCFYWPKNARVPRIDPRT